MHSAELLSIEGEQLYFDFLTRLLFRLGATYCLKSRTFFLSFLNLRSPANREAVESTCVLVDVLLTHFGRVDALTKLHVELVDVKNKHLVIFNGLETLVDKRHEV